MMTLQESKQLMSLINEYAGGTTLDIFNESVQASLSDKVLDKMFTLTVGKYNKIDFAEIERSRGDITKVKYYKNLKECLDTLNDLNAVSNKLPEAVTVSNALLNIESLTKTFEFGFKTKNNSAIMVYNIISYAIMEATSYLIAASVNMVKSGEDMEVTVCSIGKDAALISALDKFNLSVADGSIVKFITKSQEVLALDESAAVDDAIRGLLSFLGNHKEGVKTTATVAGIVIAALCIGSKIIPFIREIVYLIYKLRYKISEAAKLQAEFLEMNIEILRSRDGNEKVIAKQKSAANKFLSLSRAFSLDIDKSKRDTDMEISREKIDVSDVII
jgi:hypothetical protein